MNVKTGGKHIIVFDIGGTWFRSGIVTLNGSVVSFSKRPAFNYKNTTDLPVLDLQRQLIRYLEEEVIRLRNTFPQMNLSDIAISMGAALNAHSGYVFNSGPLWGPNSLPLDLHRKLNAVLPGTNISIINDVSAALLRELSQASDEAFSKMMLITVSTGIACRIIERETRKISVDRTYGLQGEIGHLPIMFTHNGKVIHMKCDCGGLDHLNAFCSGRGIENLLRQVENKDLSFEDFVELIQRGDKVSVRILDSVTRPLAELLLITFTLDPEVEKVILTGGVVHSLGEHYLGRILFHLNQTGMYQVTDRNPDFFKERISLGKDDDKSCLIGAALSIIGF